MRRIIAILVLTLLAQIAKANTSDDLLTSVGALIPNYTNIYLVNMTSGDAYNGWNVTNLFVDPNGMHVQWTEFTSAQKALVSTNPNNSTLSVNGMGSGYGGQDCTHKQGSTASCTNYNISSCLYYYQYSVSIATACQWVGVCNGGGQPCLLWPFFEFVFQTTKANAASLTVTVNTWAGQGNPVQIQHTKLYLWNYTTTAWDFVANGSGSKQGTLTTAAATSDLTDYVNPSGQVMATIIGEADDSGLIPNMGCYYAQCAVGYNGMIQ